ncbi:MAG: cell division protease FtsH [Frankiaceae bacterium]|jgi:cell division protease FtsH|nr:cell division protease FtsH [Frankiaceae bacterium]
MTTEQVRSWAGNAWRAGRHAVNGWTRRWRRARVARSRTRSRQTYVLLLLLLMLGGIFATCLSYLAPEQPGRQIGVNAFGELAKARRLGAVELRDEDSQITGVATCAAPKATVLPCNGPPARFWLSYPKSNAATATLLQQAAEAGAPVTVDPQTRKGQVRVVTMFVLPLLMLATAFVLLSSAGRGGSSGIGAVEMFGSIGARNRFGRRKHAPVTFADIAGADEAVDELREVRDYLANPERYTEIGASPPKGVLFVGPPGCGKTLLAKAVAGEVGVPFFSVAGAEFVESLVGVGAARVRDLFRRVRAAAPAIVFVDELDAVGRKRAQGGGGGGSDEREQTLNQLLVEMDGFDVSSGIVVMGATNRPDILDPALLRPGRFDRQVTIERPDLPGRTRILELHARGKPFAVDVDFGYVARRTPGFSGADLANVVNESALLAVRQGKEEIETGDLEEAIQRVLSGTSSKGRMLTEEERTRVAYHEAGHVVAAAAGGRIGDVHRVSILTRGHSLGTASVRADAEAALLTREQLVHRLVVHLAGIAAEELRFGSPSTGAEKDLADATALARDLVARYGMSPALGRMRLCAPEVEEFLDADAEYGVISGQLQYEAETEIRRLLADAEREARLVLTTHRATMDEMAARLEVEETIEGPELEALLAKVQPELELLGSFASSNGHAKRTPLLVEPGQEI